MNGGRRFGGFALVGGAGFCADAGLLAAGLALGLPAAAARAVSAGAAIHLTFALNDRLVFADAREHGLARRWAGYLLANGFGALCNYVVFVFLTHSGLPLAGRPVPAFLAAAGVGLLVNYLGSRSLAFRTAPTGAAP